jgi:L-alanine-DL-glutamate epimerase-like enolase superfamily enzyme
MKIESVDLFYLAMPEITTAADGSQDALLVRVRSGNYEGWGECEASPLASIAAYVGPMSHGICRPVRDSVLGCKVNGPEDITRIALDVEYNSMDLLHAPHVFSGIEMALWDLLGKQRGQPVWRLIGYSHAYPKLPYASMLFGDTAEQTLERSKAACAQGFRAVKFGWGPFAQSSVEADADQLQAARDGTCAEGTVCIHPKQVGAVRAAFAPTEAELDWARRVLAAAASGVGAVQVDGRMVDRPVLRKAQSLLDFALPAQNLS